MRPFIPLLLLFGLLAPCCLAQRITINSTEPVDAKSIHPWVVKEAHGYAGVYHFGISEVESDFILCVEQGVITAQIVSGSWSDTKATQWISQYQNLRNVRITGNKFAADQLSGEFITYTDEDGQTAKGLRVHQPWSASVEQGQWEVGGWSTTLPTYFDYPFGVASYRLLRPADLQGRTPADLALMRNSIFARYGYIFTKGGAMDRHFRRFDWYRPQHRDVSQFLTAIERRNLVLIQQAAAQPTNKS